MRVNLIVHLFFFPQTCLCCNIQVFAILCKHIYIVMHSVPVEIKRSILGNQMGGAA